jgi:hypothetical protein
MGDAQSLTAFAPAGPAIVPFRFSPARPSPPHPNAAAETPSGPQVLPIPLVDSICCFVAGDAGFSFVE